MKVCVRIVKTTFLQYIPIERKRVSLLKLNKAINNISWSIRSPIYHVNHIKIIKILIQLT